MQRALDIEAIFPIKDAASAALMVTKADCLHRAGIIAGWEERWVYSRARRFLDDDSLIRDSVSPSLPAAPVEEDSSGQKMPIL